MRLTKTEQRILDRLRDKVARGLHPWTGAEGVVGNGPEGGRIKFGWREYRACRSLVEKGLVKLVNTSFDTQSNRGWGTDHYIITIQLERI